MFCWSSRKVRLQTLGLLGNEHVPVYVSPLRIPTPLPSVSYNLTLNYNSASIVLSLFPVHSTSLANSTAGPVA